MNVVFLGLLIKQPRVFKKFFNVLAFEKMTED